MARAVDLGGGSAARMSAPHDDPVTVLQRWADAGAVWRVLGRHHDGSVTVGLYRCDGGEEVDRIISTDSRLLEYLRDRASSEE